MTATDKSFQRIATVWSDTADKVAEVMEIQFMETFTVQPSKVGDEYKTIVLPVTVRLSHKRWQEFNTFAHGASAAFQSGL